VAGLAAVEVGAAPPVGGVTVLVVAARPVQPKRKKRRRQEADAVRRWRAVIALECREVVPPTGPSHRTVTRSPPAEAASA